ncbi:hypothetical protein ES288_D02G293900v1 [Gossypium darwinii]|uniref:Uncharacterized protein n=1 Tax=Gossypium darwinii TaxID=34276 RepID=A0A5D2DKM3_GOSDA|nr:hypothetical protein ES288_D02G293900v1 [Gossypium darwinii]
MAFLIGSRLEPIHLKDYNSISLHVRLGNTDEYNSIFNQNPSISPHGYINNHTKLPIQLIYGDTMGYNIYVLVPSYLC